MLRRGSCSKIEEIVLVRSGIESRKLQGGVPAGRGRGVGSGRGGFDGGEGHSVDAFGTGLQQGVGEVVMRGAEPLPRRAALPRRGR